MSDIKSVEDLLKLGSEAAVTEWLEANKTMRLVPLAEIERLNKREDWLECLECAGVDNWQGWDYACEIRDGEHE